MRSILFGFCFGLAVAACGGTESTTTTANATTDGGGGEPDSNGCCPRDTTQSGCMNLGGAVPFGGSCSRSCDFFGSTSWRVEKDEKGCEVWRYDMQAIDAGK